MVTLSDLRLQVANYENWLSKTVIQAVVTCQERQLKDNLAPKKYYLHHKEGGLAFFSEEEGTPEGWTLSHSEPLRRLTYYHELCPWVMEVARHLHCLPRDLASLPEKVGP